MPSTRTSLSRRCRTTEIPIAEPFDFAEALRPVNWFLLTADDAYAEWHDLDLWVKRVLRDTYGLPPAILPPLWHRHDELIWELSALHLDGQPSQLSQLDDAACSSRWSRR